MISLNYNIVNLSVDIFSASTIPRQFYKTNNNKEFILWKIDRNMIGLSSLNL